MMRHAPYYVGASRVLFLVGYMVTCACLLLGAYALHVGHEYTHASDAHEARAHEPMQRTHTSDAHVPMCTHVSGKAGMGMHVRTMQGTCTEDRKESGMPRVPATYEDETYVRGTDGTMYPATRCNAEDEVLAPTHYEDGSTVYVCTHIDNV